MIIVTELVVIKVSCGHKVEMFARFCLIIYFCVGGGGILALHSSKSILRIKVLNLFSFFFNMKVTTHPQRDLLLTLS